MTRRRGALETAIGSILVVAMILLALPGGATVGADSPTAEAIRNIDPKTIAPGETVQVTVQFTSLLGHQEGFGLVEEIPAGWVFQSIDDADATAVKQGGKIEWLWLSVTAGATKTVIYTLKAPDDAAAGDYSVDGVVKAAGVDNLVLGDDTITMDPPAPPPSATAEATRTIDPQTIAPGETVQVTVEFKSLLGYDEGFALVEDIPAGWVFQSIDDAGATEVKQDGKIEWLWLSVTAGTTKTVVYTLKAPDDAASGYYSVDGVVKAAQIDNLVLGDDTIEVDPAAPPPSETAEATRTIDPQTIAPGETVQVTVEFKSLLGYDEGFALVEDIPAGWVFQSIDDAGATAVKQDGKIEWLWLSVTAGTTKTVVYTLKAPDDAASGGYSVDGVVKAAQMDNLVLGDDTITVDPPAPPPSATAEATRTINPKTAKPGATIQVTVQFRSLLTDAAVFGLVENIPAGWKPTVVNSGDAQYVKQDGTVELVWFSVPGGATRTVAYTLKVPSNAAAGAYSINGVVKAFVKALGVDDTPVAGDNTVTLEVTDFPPPVHVVGWETSEINKIAVAAPLIIVFAVIILGASLSMLRRRRARIQTI